MNWSYGITTVPSRLHTYFPKTLESLEAAGFDNPRLFIDGAESTCEYEHLGLEMTVRTPKINLFGNWFLALWELYIRNPDADRYALFQDDILLCKNTRQYLEQLDYPERGYWNLYIAPEVQTKIPTSMGFHQSTQKGRGALALIFSKEHLCEILTHHHCYTKPQNAFTRKRHKNIDGCIVSSMIKLGYKEYVHNPSLAYHIGDKSSLLNAKYKPTISFRGEDFDAMELLND